MQTPSVSPIPERSQSPNAASCNGSVTSVTSWQRKRREEILLLKKSVPSKLELLRVLESHPAEGERLVRFCRRVQQKIHEMESEYRESVQQSDVQRREDIRRRAASHFAANQSGVIEKFMDKTLEAEDRQAALSECRQRDLEAKQALEFVRATEAEEERQRIDAERLAHLSEKRQSWHRAVATVEQQRVASRAEKEALSAQHQQDFEARRQAERQAFIAEQARLSRLAQKMDADLQRHGERHEMLLRERRSAAARFAKASAAHPDAFEKKLDAMQQKVRESDRRVEKSIEVTAQRRKLISDSVRSERTARMARAKDRLQLEREQHDRKAQEFEQALQRRLQRHAERIEDQQKEVLERSTHKARKSTACRTAVEDGQEQRFVAMSQRIIDRTIRIGSSLGVELPPVLSESTMYITASAPRPERQARQHAATPQPGNEARLTKLRHNRGSATPGPPRQQHQRDEAGQPEAKHAAQQEAWPPSTSRLDHAEHPLRYPMLSCAAFAASPASAATLASVVASLHSQGTEVTSVAPITRSALPHLTLTAELRGYSALELVAALCHPASAVKLLITNDRLSNKEDAAHVRLMAHLPVIGPRPHAPASALILVASLTPMDSAVRFIAMQRSPH